MTATPDHLRYRLRVINNEIKSLLAKDRQCCFWSVEPDGELISDYDYDHGEITKRLDALFAEQRVIRMALANYNRTHVLEDFGFSVEEALIRLQQLRRRATALNHMATMDPRYSFQPGRCITGLEEIRANRRAIKAAEKELGSVLREISALRMAVDQANHATLIECNISIPMPDEVWDEEEAEEEDEEWDEEEYLSMYI